MSHLLPPAVTHRDARRYGSVRRLIILWFTVILLGSRCSVDPGVQLTLAGPSEATGVGQPIYVSATFRNVSGKDLNFNFDGPMSILKLHVFDSKGELALRNGQEPVFLRVAGGPYWVPAGFAKTTTVRIDELYPIDHPGAYKIFATSAVFVERGKEAALKSNVVVINIR